MNSLYDFEVIDFPYIEQDLGKQTYDISFRILYLYSRMKEFKLNTINGSDLPELYTIFSELNEIAHVDVSEEVCNTVFKDPAVRSLLPAIHRNYSNFFSVHETHLAHEILNHADPWKMLESLPLYQRYVNLIKVQAQNSPDIETLALVGCGPLPVTLLLFSKLYGIRCIGIDSDPEAAALAKSCVKHFGLEKEISVVPGNETALSGIEWDSVLIAGLAEPKIRIFQNLRNIIKKKFELGKPNSICYRNYTGMRQLLYRPVMPEQIRGFRKVKEINPTDGVNNTLVFLECE